MLLVLCVNLVKASFVRTVMTAVYAPEFLNVPNSVESTPVSVMNNKRPLDYSDPCVPPFKFPRVNLDVDEFKLDEPSDPDPDSPSSTSPPSSENHTPPPDSPGPPPPVVQAVVPPILYTLRPGNNPKNYNYHVGVPYQVFELADKPMSACLEPAPVVNLDGLILHLYFQIASVAVVQASVKPNQRVKNEDIITAKMLSTGMSRDQLESSGPPCPGITMPVSDYWYSLACFYESNRNVVTTGKDDSKSDGLTSRCRGCDSHYKTLNLRRLKSTFDIQSAQSIK